LRIRSWFILLSLLAVATMAWYGIRLDREIVRQFSGKRWGLPSKIYSDAFLLSPGQRLESIHLFERLKRLGYRRVDAYPPREGEYYKGPDHLEISLHDFRYPHRAFSGFRLRVELQGTRITRLSDRKHARRDLVSAALEPELIAGLFERLWEARTLVTLKQVPQYLVDAIIATEDKRFYHHSGVDPLAIGRAAIANIKAKRVVQGASTLTQQLVKNFFLSNRRSVITKAKGAFMAILLERHFSKDEILEAYLNEIYFGQRGIQGIYGAGEAASFYFDTTVEELSLAESALLAGLIRAPNMYCPFRNPELMRTRRNHVLRRMWSLGMITEEQYNNATSAPVTVKEFSPQTNDAPYFVDHVIQELSRDFSLEFLTSEGLRIFTTLDVEMQRTAQRILKEELSRLEAAYPRTSGDRGVAATDHLQGCIVVLQPHTGYLRALIGGRDYQQSGFNRATQARRQPGSLFKPIVYLTALERPSPGGDIFTPTSLLKDEPLTIQYEHTQWSPRNYNEQYLGNVSLRRALEMSLNCATVRLSQSVGLEHIIAKAKDLGLTTPLESLPSLALGAFEAIPLEMAGAYCALANQGTLYTPTSIKEVVDREGKTLARKRPVAKGVASPEGAFLTTYLLKGVIDRGTASSCRATIPFPAAGKTGTTNNYQDAWFLGYTPSILALVWVGFDAPESLGLSGAQAALPIWARLMNEIATPLPHGDFAPPPGIVFRKIDRASGLLATTGCPDPFLEAYRSGTEPVDYCPLHPAPTGIGEVMKKIRKGFFDKILDLFR
jgi:penicillin-binding protein 1B